MADASTGCILQVNRATEKLLNRPRTELIGLHYSVLHPPGEDEKYAAEFARHVRGETSYINAEVYTRDGRRIPVEITSSLVQMPNGVWTLQGFFRDITDRQMSETAIHQQFSF